MRHQLLRQSQKQRWWRLHRRLWRWRQVPSAFHRKRPDTWPRHSGHKWVWLANSRAVCATESTELDWPHSAAMGDLRLWICQLSNRPFNPIYHVITLVIMYMYARTCMCTVCFISQSSVAVFVGVFLCYIYFYLIVFTPFLVKFLRHQRVLNQEK